VTLDTRSQRTDIILSLYRRCKRLAGKDIPHETSTSQAMHSSPRRRGIALDACKYSMIPARGTVRGGTPARAGPPDADLTGESRPIAVRDARLPRRPALCMVPAELRIHKTDRHQGQCTGAPGDDPAHPDHTRRRVREGPDGRSTSATPGLRSVQATGAFAEFTPTGQRPGRRLERVPDGQSCLRTGQPASAHGRAAATS